MREGDDCPSGWVGWGCVNEDDIFRRTLVAGGGGKISQYACLPGLGSVYKQKQAGRYGMALGIAPGGRL